MPGPPPAPDGLVCLTSETYGAIDLSWDAVPDVPSVVTGYQFRSAASDGVDMPPAWGVWTNVPGGVVTAHTDIAAGPGVLRLYQVRAVSEDVPGEVEVGEPSQTDSAVGADVPSPPMVLTAVQVGEVVVLYWLPPESDGGWPVVHYEWQVSVDGGPWSAIAATFAPNAVHPCGGVCRYRVRAATVVGPGAWATTTIGTTAGGCTPWLSWDDIGCGCPDPPEVTDQQQAHALAQAQELLWYLTGSQYGLCSDTVRPCRPCRCEYVPCACGAYDRLYLARQPIVSVDEVVIDGVVLDPDAYRLDDHHYLTRIDGLAWPYCQSMASAGPGVFTVTYTYGTPVPLGLVTAAATLACEIAKACIPGGACKLGERVRTISREGVTFGVVDLEATKGGTGLPSVDMAIETWGGTLGTASTVVGMFDPARGPNAMRLGT